MKNAPAVLYVLYFNSMDDHMKYVPQFVTDKHEKDGSFYTWGTGTWRYIFFSL